MALWTVRPTAIGGMASSSWNWCRNGYEPLEALIRKAKDMSDYVPMQLNHQRGCGCIDCALLRERSFSAAAKAQEKRQRMPLHLSIAHLVTEFMAGVKAGNFPAGANVEAHLSDAVQRRVRRYVSADHIAMILSEDAQIEHGKLTNAAYLAVRIAESIERGEAT